MRTIKARSASSLLAICLMTACDSGDAKSAEQPSGANAPTGAEKAVAQDRVEGIRALPEEQQLKLAMLAVFPDGNTTRLRHDAGRTDSDPDTIVYKAGKLIWAPFGPVLIAPGVNQNTYPVSLGVLGIYYLKETDGKLVLAKAWPEWIDGSIMGNPPEWEVSDTFIDDVPVIISKSGGVWQGVACQNTAIHGLYKDGGPGLLVTFPSMKDESSSSLPKPHESVEGKIENVVKNKSFDVRFTGTQDYVAHFEKEFDSYNRTDNGPEFPAC